MTQPGPGWYPRGSDQHVALAIAEKEARESGRKPKAPHPPGQPRQPRVPNTVTLANGRELRIHKVTDLLWRPETDDSSVLGERKDYQAMFDAATQDDILLDLGGHIGIVACMFAPKVKSIITVEPDEDNLNLLGYNLERQEITNVLVVPGAVTLEGGTRDLWLNGGKGKCAHSLSFRRGRTSTPVETHRLTDLINAYEPTLLKCDIEGGEFELMPVLANLPTYIRMVAIELHYSQKNWREELAPQVHANFLAQGFTAIVEPDFETAWRGTTPVYTR